MIWASLEDYNLIGLGYYDAGFRSFYAGRPVNTPEDLRGMKIRVQESPIAMRMVRALGGSPTPISWGELYTALQQGIVDGAENNSPSFQTSMHYRSEERRVGKGGGCRRAGVRRTERGGRRER